jgi:hypothetical protein
VRACVSACFRLVSGSIPSRKRFCTDDRRHQTEILTGDDTCFFVFLSVRDLSPDLYSVQPRHRPRYEDRDEIGTGFA